MRKGGWVGGECIVDGVEGRKSACNAPPKYWTKRLARMEPPMEARAKAVKM